VEVGVAEDRAGAHLPHPVTIEGYGGGGFRFAEMSHRGSLLCLPSGLWPWPVERATEIEVATLARVFAEAAAIDFLILGTGRDLVPVAEPLRRRLREVGIGVEPMATGIAVPTWNLLHGEGRRVAAGLLAVD
jgi:uncharacterized protein